MSGLRIVGSTALAFLFLFGLPYALTSYVAITNLWGYLREHHFKAWIALGGPDALTELLTQRGFGSMKKIYSALEPIDDAELKKMLLDMQQGEQFACRVFLPLFVVAVASFVVNAIIDAII